MSIPRKFARLYHSVGSAVEYKSPLNLIRESLNLQPKAASILLNALDTQVPVHGFTESAVTAELRDQGYSDAARQVFPNGRGGALDLVLAHLVRQRSNIFSQALGPVENTNSNGATSAFVKSKSVTDNVAQLVKLRIKGNEPIAERLPDILALLAIPTNLPSSLAELHQLSDDIWFLAGDESHDFSWYNKRMALSSVYAATELFMSQDRSSGFRDTYEFLDRRLHEAETARYALESVTEWGVFNAIAVYNIQKAIFSRG